MMNTGDVRFSDVMKASGCVLAFDTAEDFGTVVVARVTASGVTEWLSQRRIDQPRQQASLLTPTISDALSDAGISFPELAGVIVGAGPGSFTGIRVAAATAKGLLFGWTKPLWAPSSLLGAALDPGWGPCSLRAVAFDARGDRVYAAMYACEPNAPPREVLAPAATTIGEFVRVASQKNAVLAGSAFRRHREVVAETGTLLEAPLGDPSAVGLIQALTLDPAQLAVEHPAQFEPAYLRGSSAVPLAYPPQG